MKNIQHSSKSNEKLDSKILTMVFGDDNTIFKKFNCDYKEDIDFLEKNKGKVGLAYIGFAVEWQSYVNFYESYAYIDNNKLYVVVYGLPEHINKKSVKKYFEETLEQYIASEYGEFFVTNPGCPICMIVERNNVEVIV